MLVCVLWILCAGYGLDCGCCGFFSAFQRLGVAVIHIVPSRMDVCTREDSFLLAIGTAACICCSVIGGCISWPSTQTWSIAIATSMYFARIGRTSQNDTSLIVFGPFLLRVVEF